MKMSNKERYESHRKLRANGFRVAARDRRIFSTEKKIKSSVGDIPKLLHDLTTHNNYSIQLEFE